MICNKFARGNVKWTMKRRDKKGKKKKTREREGVAKKEKFDQRSVITEKRRVHGLTPCTESGSKGFLEGNEQLLYFIYVSLAIASFIGSRDQRLWISVIVFASSSVAESLNNVHWRF